MARNISFFLTKRQFLDRSKDVTRRLGWNWVKPGDVLCGIEKGGVRNPGGCHEVAPTMTNTEMSKAGQDEPAPARPHH
jgi:hypothetical protein